MSGISPIFLVPLTLLAAAGAAPVGPADPALLREVSRAYRSFAQFQLSGTLTIETDVEGQPPQRIEAPIRMAGRRSGGVHENVVHPQIGMLTVSDGDTTWTYSPTRNQYLKRVGRVPYAGDSATASRGSVAASLFSNYRGIEQGIGSSRQMPPETLRFAGRDRPVRVVEVTYPNVEYGTTVKRFWVDPATGHVLRHRMETAMWGGEGDERRQLGSRVETVVYDRLEIDRPVPDSLFAFVPPAGAQDVEQAARAPSPFTGKPASEFALKDLAGKTHSLKAQRGKVVMLDFWATWCGPCRMQMPLVDKLSKEFTQKGLVVYAVNVGESAAKAQAYLTKNSYTTTTLLDPKGETGTSYGASGIPTLVVIDRKGTISSHFVGVHGEQDLREALRKAGIE